MKPLASMITKKMRRNMTSSTTSLSPLLSPLKEPLSLLPGQDIAWLNIHRTQALEQFITQGFPKKRDEAWRYTSLYQLNPEILIPTASNINHATPNSSYALDGAHPYIIYNGHFSPSSAPLPHGIKIAALSTIYQTKDDSVLEMIKPLLEQKNLINNSSVTALNNALTNEGIVLIIPKQTECSTPIDIHYIQDSGTVYTQLFIVMEPGSKATIKEHFYSPQHTARYQHHVSRIHLQQGATLQHYRVQSMPTSCTHIYSQETKLETNSDYYHFSLNSGGQIARHEIASYLQGKKARSVIHGVTLGNKNQHHDTYLPTFHQHPDAYSDQHLRQVLKDEAKGIYYSSVKVDKNCPKSEAHQLCHTILLGKKAQGYARPELDILTDDVICSHGATTGAIDEQALYYLQSRGINQELAIALLLESFSQEVAEMIPLPAMKQLISDLIKQWGSV
jgi:Fe-S cluster assembly protein SufD